MLSYFVHSKMNPLSACTNRGIGRPETERCHTADLVPSRKAQRRHWSIVVTSVVIGFHRLGGRGCRFPSCARRPAIRRSAVLRSIRKELSQCAFASNLPRRDSGNYPRRQRYQSIGSRQSIGLPAASAMRLMRVFDEYMHRDYEFHTVTIARCSPPEFHETAK